ncbi:phytoene desaturase [Rhodovulum sp. P5]|uniref:phytoene desaturase n=1 Tax=Rhodovulum sp. P5 TaxID=1564506 RepID=UPI00352BF8F5
MTRVDPALADEAVRADRPHAVVIGAGLGGLAAAMRLGAKGYRVTVVDKLDVPGGRGSAIWQDGHRFDLGPTIVTVPWVFEELWKACGREFKQDVELAPMDPFYEIVFDDGERFRACQDTDRMRAEVARLSPSDLEGYDKFLKDSEKRYWFGFENLGRRPMHEWWELGKVLHIFGMLRADKSVYAHAASRVKDERLRMALSFHPLFIGGDPFNVTSMYILVSYLEKEFGVHYAMGGVAAIAKAMADVVEWQGGLMRLETEVDEILVKKTSPKRFGKVTGVKLASGEVIDADLVVSNADSGFTYSHLMRNVPRWRWTDETLNKKRWSMGLFVWYFGTKGTRDMWKDVGHHTVLNGPRYKGLVREIFFDQENLADDMSLYIHRPSVTDPSAAPEGDDTFYALSPVPNLHSDNPIDWKANGERYRQMVQDFMEEKLMPGLGDKVSTSLYFTPETFQMRYLSPFGAGFSLEPRIFQSANFRPHNISEEVEGLYMVGAGTHPGAGLPSVITSAEVMAKLVPDAAPASAD